MVTTRRTVRLHKRAWRTRSGNPVNFEFEKEIAKLDESGRLYLVIGKFADIDLHLDYNNEVFAICCSDMMIKAQNPENIGSCFSGIAYDFRLNCRTGLFRTGHDPNDRRTQPLLSAESRLQRWSSSATDS